jgi:RimJ/RimL family protein N-acetyltransferase
VVRLVAVDDTVLEQLVQAAVTEAVADEVTPPLTAGPSWTPTRVAWLRDFHRDRRLGLAGPAGEASWAVVFDERVVGSVRLRQCEAAGVLETGIWLTRGARGRGIGRAAMTAVLDEAADLGAQEVHAQTTVDNVVAQGVLRRLGFHLEPADDGQGVQALVVLNLEVSGDVCR